MQKFKVRRKVLETHETVIEAESFAAAQSKAEFGFIVYDNLVDTKESYKVEYIGEVDDNG